MKNRHNTIFFKFCNTYLNEYYELEVYTGYFDNAVDALSHLPYAIFLLVDTMGVSSLKESKRICLYNIETNKKSWKEEIKGTIKEVSKQYKIDNKNQFYRLYKYQQRVRLFTVDNLDNNNNNRTLKYSLSKNQYKAFIVFLMQKYHITSQLGYLLFKIGCNTHELNFSLHDILTNENIKVLKDLYQNNFNEYVRQIYDNIFYEDFRAWIKNKNLEWMESD